jgi:nitrile hydratase accessory protein
MTAALLDVEGVAAPPRSNGELVFAEPWEGRAFGLAVTLHGSGAFEWDEFRRQLIARIASWEADHNEDEPFGYYRCWLQALQTVIENHGMISSAEIANRAEALAARPTGHDHGHDHRSPDRSADVGRRWPAR